MLMAKRAYNFGVRDILIAILAFGLIFTNYVLFDSLKNQDITNSGSSQAWLFNQFEIEKLKACVDNHSSTCDITTGAPSLSK